MKLARQLYNWVLHWAATPYGALALFVLAFAESSFFPVPPDVLLMALCVANKKKAFLYAALCLSGSVAGGLFGYYIGHELWYTQGQFSDFANFFFIHVPGFNQEVFYKVKHIYEENAFWVLFSAGFTPIPYKIFTITAGVTKINLWLFLAVSGLSRGLRFFLVAGIFHLFGESISQWINRYFNILTIVFTLLLILGFVLLKFSGS